MTNTQLTIVVIAMIIAVTLVAVTPVPRTGTIGKLTVLGTVFVNILTTLLGS